MLPATGATDKIILYYFSPLIHAVVWYLSMFSLDMSRLVRRLSILVSIYRNLLSRDGNKNQGRHTSTAHAIIMTANSTQLDHKAIPGS